MDEDADFFPNDFDVCKTLPDLSFDIEKYLSDHGTIKRSFNEELKPAEERSPKPKENKIISKDDDVFHFFNRFDTISLFSQHSCLCQSIIRAFAFSMNSLIPLIKMSVRVKKRDLDFLDHVCLCLENVGIFETHAYFCNQLGISDFINRVLDRRSILSIFHVNILNTFYCAHCKYQRITTSEKSALILDSPCSYASPEVVKQSWFCPTCLSDRNSCIESKIRIPKKSTAFMLFTMKGITSLTNVYDQPKLECELQTALGGKFFIKYFLVQQENNFSYFESYKGKWRSINSQYFVPKYCYYDSPPFLSKNIRAIIWHHSKPCVVARRLLTVKSITSNLKFLNAAASTSNKNNDTLQSSPVIVAPPSTSVVQNFPYNGNDNAEPLKLHSEFNDDMTKLKPIEENTLNFLQEFNLTNEINDLTEYNGLSWFNDLT